MKIFPNQCKRAVFVPLAPGNQPKAHAIWVCLDSELESIIYPFYLRTTKLGDKTNSAERKHCINFAILAPNFIGEILVSSHIGEYLCSDLE